MYSYLDLPIDLSRRSLDKDSGLNHASCMIKLKLLTKDETVLASFDGQEGGVQSRLLSSSVVIQFGPDCPPLYSSPIRMLAGAY